MRRIARPSRWAVWSVVAAVGVITGACSASDAANHGEAPTAPVGTELIQSGSVRPLLEGSRKPLRTRWVEQTGVDIRSALVGDHQVVLLGVASNGESTLVSLDRGSGARRWRRVLPYSLPSGLDLHGEGGTDIEKDLLAVDPTIVVRSPEGYGYEVRGYDPDTGRQVWSQLADASIAPLAGGRFLTMATTSDDGSTTRIVDARSGRIRWSTTGDLLASDDQTVYVYSDDKGRIEARDLSSGEARWTTPSSHRMNGLVVDGRFTFTENDVLSSFDTATGTRQWSTASDTLGPGPQVEAVSGTDLLVSGRDGLVAVDARTGRIGRRSSNESGIYLPRSNDVGDGAATIDRRWLVTTTAIVDLRSRKQKEFPDDWSIGRWVQQQSVTLLTNDGPEFHLRRLAVPTGETIERAVLGQAAPGVIPVGDGLLITNLGRAGTVWLGSGRATGPSLARAVADARRDRPRPAETLDGTGALGVPFGTEAEEAVAALTDVIGPPTGFQSPYEEQGRVWRVVTWGDLKVFLTQGATGPAQLTGWMLLPSADAEPWPLADGASSSTSAGKVEDFGYTLEDRDRPTRWCSPRPSVCLDYDGEGVQVPLPSSSTPQIVTAGETL